ncbi:DUF4434 domain-containing protein [Candidatus Daviesbacteria bacterium]|nr:DUF4434 domain-containing protein [Candidatus Daviesbacteria bacterium]
MTSQKGSIAVLMIILLIAGIAVGTLLVEQRTNFLPHAKEPKPNPSAATRIWKPDFFPVGVWLLLNDINSNNFPGIAQEFKDNGIDLIHLVWFNKNELPLLDIADKVGINVEIDELYLDGSWWKIKDPSLITLERARSLIYPVVDLYKTHPSVKSYFVVDEPEIQSNYLPQLTKKITFATQAFQERDPARPAYVNNLSPYSVREYSTNTASDILSADIYSYDYTKQSCTGRDNSRASFINSIKAFNNARPQTKPFWVILQAFSNPTSRMPTKSELRTQQWISIGEGVKGIIWFIYNGDSNLTGFSNNPEIKQEIYKLAKRIAPFKQLLLSLEKTSSLSDTSLRFDKEPGYLGYLKDKITGKQYVVLLNPDCRSNSLLKVTIRVRRSTPTLKDLETGQIYSSGDLIPFEAGDGRIFEIN